MEKIDFVVLWVKGDDPVWLAEKEYYQKNYGIPVNSNPSQYRDWDTFRYWFRAIENNAPWVNKIHLVTCGHVPEWLNISNKKLNIVSHSDYIPLEYLPTFSSHVIEMFLHKIPSLSEKFVFFNDDMFVNSKVSAEDFFIDELPVDCAIMETLSPTIPMDPFVHYLANDISVINHNFNKLHTISKNLDKFFSLKYGKLGLKNVLNCFSGGFSGFHNFHMAQAYLKSTFQEVWKTEPEILFQTAKNKFRNRMDVNQYVFKYWQIASGKFVPYNPQNWKMYTIGENNNTLYRDILQGEHSIICINDSLKKLDYEIENANLVKCFEQRYPQKSLFEKD